MTHTKYKVLKVLNNFIYSEDSPEPIAVCNYHDTAIFLSTAPELLEALENLLTELHNHHKMNVKKDYSLMLADAASRKVIHKAKGE